MLILFWVCDNGEIILLNEEDLLVDLCFEKFLRKCFDGSELKFVIDVFDCWVDLSIILFIIIKWYEVIKGDEEGKKWFEYNFLMVLRL